MEFIYLTKKKRNYMQTLAFAEISSGLFCCGMPTFPKYAPPKPLSTVPSFFS